MEGVPWYEVSLPDQTGLSMLHVPACPVTKWVLCLPELHCSAICAVLAHIHPVIPAVGQKGEDFVLKQFTGPDNSSVELCLTS